jgi:cytochrome P450
MIFVTLLLRELLRRPELWEEVKEHRELLPGVIEESLRLSPPVRTVRRLVTADATIGEVEIAAGDEVVLMLSSANRDEDMFPDGGEFDAQRSNAKRHVSFGRFTHMCIGAPLAKLEAQVAIETVMDRLPNVRLAGPAPTWEMALLAPWLTSLPLEWDRRGPDALSRD